MINMKISNMQLFFPLIILIASCGVDQHESRSQKSIRGLISEVRSKSLLEVDWFELETGDLSKRRFVIEDQIRKFTPSHFRHHMVTGEFVKVDYWDEKGVLIAINVVDID